MRSSAAGFVPLIAGHVIQGRVIFPGTGYLEMARAAGATALNRVFFLQPLAVEVVGLLVEYAALDGRFEVRSAEPGSNESATVHCSGATVSDSGQQHIEHASLRARSRAADIVALYADFDVVGLQYGPDYRTLVQAWGGASTATARLRARVTRKGTWVHPADLDDALCTSATIGSGGADGRLPFAVNDARLHSSMGRVWAVRCSLRQGIFTSLLY